ncbi:uroporphyrinogen-III synthase [Vibrio rarus]|uniref:uroporphyrinogen-III synthase n=1 Tax=Vibrio rarus TaxID=413403 RepID=UPI0021C31AC4|nr:uroporphyrinogen-III synthase [Vibrio rarus]
MKALIVRPQPAAKELCSALQQLGVVSQYCSVVSFQQSTLTSANLAHLLDSEIIIAVSQPAVSYADLWLKQNGKSWPPLGLYFAIGSKTASCLHSTAQHQPNFPSSEDSEGLLELLSRQPLKNRKISILRGDGGRELIFEELQRSGAQVAYIESYFRQWNHFDGHKEVTGWQQLKIDTLIVTSFEQLKFFAQQIPTQHKNWLHSLKLMVPSDRIVQLALQLGFVHIHNLQGASNQTIVNSIQGELHRKI